MYSNVNTSYVAQDEIFNGQIKKRHLILLSIQQKKQQQQYSVVRIVKKTTLTRRTFECWMRRKFKPKIPPN